MLSTAGRSPGLEVLREKVLAEIAKRKMEQDIDSRCRENCLYWLRECTLTENEQFEKEGLPFRSPFPNKQYFDVLFKVFKEKPVVFVRKSRDMMTSWSAVGWGAYQAQFFQGTTIVQTESEDKAKQLVKYAAILWENQDESLKKRYPLVAQSTMSLEWAAGGRFFGIPCGESKVRMYHPSLYIMDEAAFLPGAEALYNTAKPVAQQIIAISSAGPGWFMDECERCVGMNEYPIPGMEVCEHSSGIITVVSLHYSADPERGEGEKTFVPEINKYLTPWALKEYMGMTDKGRYLQEYEVDPTGNQGQLVFAFKQFEAAILVKPFVIPPDWTRYYAVDPHPRVPHAHLWCAVDPTGDRWYYREYWPSRAYGKKGNVPEDDERHTIREHMEVVQYMESAEANHGHAEHIRARVIDYAARSFGQGTTDDEPQEDFQKRFEKAMRELKMQRPYFQDAVKDREAGIEKVNAGLKPMPIERSGNLKEMSRIHIFDNLPELILELREARYPKLTALQAETRDPHPDPMQKRMHLADDLRYLEMANPRYHESGTHPKTVWEPGKDPDYIQAN